MKHNQIIITIRNYEDPKFFNILESLHNKHPHIKFNTFDVVRYTKPTDDKLEENEFTFRLLTRQYNGAHDLDLLNGELETRMQEQEMNQSEWSMQRFTGRTMYIHRFYPNGGFDTELPFTSRYILNIHNSDNKYLLWCLIAYLHPAPHNPSRVSNYNKPENNNEIKLPNGVTPPYDYYHLKKIRELSKDKLLFNVFNLNKNKTINHVLINHNDPKGCNILHWDNHYFLCKDVAFLLRKSPKHKCYPCLKCCVSFRTEDALNKYFDLCNTQKHIGRRTFHKDEYLKFDNFLCKDVAFLLRKSPKHKCYPCLKCCVSFRTKDALNKYLDLCNTQKHIGRRTFHKDKYLKFDNFHYKNEYQLLCIMILNV